jgi:hypothetical protein
MSNNQWDDEDDDDDTSNQNQGGDSDLLKQLRKANKAKDRELKEVKDQLETLTKVSKERVVKEVLEKKGVNPKAVRLALKDIDDVTEENVNKWLEDNADLFSNKTNTELSAEEQENLDALTRQDDTTQGAGSPGAGSDLEKKMAAMSLDELREFLKTQ